MALRAEDIHVDLFALRQISAVEARTYPIETLIQLEEQSRGEFLEGLDLSAQHGFQAWCIGEREEVRAKRAVLLGALVERLAAAPTEALGYARTLVEIDPFAEAPRATLVRLLAQVGRREEAEQHYAMGMRLLAEAGTPSTGELRRAWQDHRPSPLPQAAPMPDVPEPSTAAVLEATPVPDVPETPITVERKTVTALVAAITEIQEKGDTADPEVLMRQLDPLLQAMRGIVERYEGVVTATVANGLTAIFGAPVTHEDDAVRACYAALAMDEAVRALSQGECTLTVGI